MPSASLLVHSTALSAVAGYVDAAGFASLLGIFPAHLTGELVGDALAISSGHPASHTHLWVFPVFVGAVILATLVARLFRHFGLAARSGLLALVMLALGLFSASDALAELCREGHLPILLRGGFAVAAMGFQSALMRESLTGSCPTTVMTGNLTHVVIELVDHAVGKLTRRAPLPGAPRSRLAPVACALLVFVFSAALGGWLTRLYGSVSVVVPTALTGVLMIRAWREDVKRRAHERRKPESTPNCEGDLWRGLLLTPGATDATNDPSPETENAELRSVTRIKAEPPVIRTPKRLTKQKRRASGIQRTTSNLATRPCKTRTGSNSGPKRN